MRFRCALGLPLTQAVVLQAARGHSVTVKMLTGEEKKLELDEGDIILDAMLDAGMDPTHDCKMGVCMTCPARVVCSPAQLSCAKLDLCGYEPLVNITGETGGRPSVALLKQKGAGIWDRGSERQYVVRRRHGERVCTHVHEHTNQRCHPGRDHRG